MKVISILALSLFLLPAGLTPASLESVVEPKPIPTTVQGAVVLADLEVGREGKVLGAVLIHGSNPFSDEMLRVVRSWRFRPAISSDRPVDSQVGVLTIFRPASFGNYGVGGPTLGYSGVAPSRADHGPLPWFISDPGYPVNSIAQGTVVLEINVDRSGGSAGIRVIRDVPGLTEHSQNAVGNWRFYPAVQSGERVVGKLVVAIVYPRPVLSEF
jgi:hypothetical protein